MGDPRLVKVGNRIKLIDNYSESDYLKIGEIYKVLEVARKDCNQDHNGASSQGIRIDVSSLDLEEESGWLHNPNWVLVNQYNCKYDCDSCKGKCEFWEEV